MEEPKPGLDSCSTTMVEDSEELEQQYEALDWMAEYSPDQVKRILQGKPLRASMTKTVWLSVSVAVFLSVVLSVIQPLIWAHGVPESLALKESGVSASAVAEDSAPEVPFSRHEQTGEEWLWMIWRIVIQVITLFFRF